MHQCRLRDILAYMVSKSLHHFGDEWLTFNILGPIRIHEDLFTLIDISKDSSFSSHIDNNNCKDTVGAMSKISSA